MSSSPPVEVVLKSLAFGGDAVGTLPDGRSIFIPYGLPGETVRVEVTKEKRKYARGRIVEMVHPAPERIQPPCRHFGACGGCDYQHIPYERQLQIKKEMLKEQLERIAGMRAINIKDCVPSPRIWNYRNHVQFHLDEDGRLGFRMARSKRVVPIDECHLPMDGIQSIWPGLDLDAGLPLERLDIREGRDKDIQIMLESRSLEIPEIIVEEVPVSVVHLVGNDSIVLAGENWVAMEVNGRAFQVSAGAFFQVNTWVAGEMVRYVLENCGTTHETTLLELFSGVGLFSAFLAPRVKQLIAVESSEVACDDFVLNLDEFENVELYEGSVEDVLSSLSVSAQIILMDPPRSGIGVDVVERITKMAADQVVYISCDPATLARDAKDLIRAGYRLEEITPFDMFPHTAHIESVSIWQR